MLRPLTALRFAAALLVFVWHAPVTRGAAVHFSLGYTGVGFFYLLSGFILTFNYEATFRSGISRQGLYTFFAARFARIYPAHLFAMLAALVILASIGGYYWTGFSVETRLMELVSQALLLQSWFPSPAIHFGLNGPAWSISVEAFFYALFPVLLFGFASFLRTSDSRAILCAAFAVWAITTASVLRVPAQFDQWNLYVFPPSRLPEFIIGMLLALAFARRPKKSPVSFDPTLLELAAILGLLLACLVSPLAPQSMRFASATMPASAFAIYVFALGRGGLSTLLSKPVCIRMGEASYGFYLIHMSVVHLVEHDFHHAGPALCWALSLALSVAFSLAIFAWVESPLRRVIRGALENRIEKALPNAAWAAAERGA